MTNATPIQTMNVSFPICQLVLVHPHLTHNCLCYCPTIHSVFFCFCVFHFCPSVPVPMSLFASMYPCPGNFHLMNIDLPAGVCAPPLDAQLPLLLSHYPFDVLLLCLSLCPCVPVTIPVPLSLSLFPCPCCCHYPWPLSLFLCPFPCSNPSVHVPMSVLLPLPRYLSLPIFLCPRSVSDLVPVPVLASLSSSLCPPLKSFCSCFYPSRTISGPLFLFPHSCPSVPVPLSLCPCHSVRVSLAIPVPLSLFLSVCCVSVAVQAPLSMSLSVDPRFCPPFPVPVPVCLSQSLSFGPCPSALSLFLYLSL